MHYGVTPKKTMKILPKNTKKDDSKGKIRCKKISTEISEQNYFTNMG
jgi:hypothetical protein